MTPDRPRRRARRTRPADPASDAVEILAADGTSLRAEVRGPRRDAIGVVVLAHAMFARRTEFDRPAGRGIAGWLVDRGWRVIAFDYRGHGDSASTRTHAGLGYDELVAGDMPAVHDFARSRAKRRQPVLLVGHSLGGHVGLAAQGLGLTAFDGVVGVAANVWLPQLEPSRARWALKRGLMAAMGAVARRAGRFPARALRIGSDDADARLAEAFARFARTGRWESADGRTDYWACLPSVRVPVLQLVSEGDRLECPPECGARFVARCAGGTEVVRITHTDDGGLPPDHMGIVTGGRAMHAWERVHAWMTRLVPGRACGS